MQCETKGFEELKPILPVSDTYFHIYSGRVNDLAPFWLASERFKAVQDMTFLRTNMTIRIWGALTIIWWGFITRSWWYEDPMTLQNDDKCQNDDDGGGRSGFERFSGFAWFHLQFVQMMGASLLKTHRRSRQIHFAIWENFVLVDI